MSSTTGTILTGVAVDKASFTASPFCVISNTARAGCGARDAAVPQRAPETSTVVRVQALATSPLTGRDTRYAPQRAVFADRTMQSSDPFADHGLALLAGVGDAATAVSHRPLRSEPAAQTRPSPAHPVFPRDVGTPLADTTPCLLTIQGTANGPVADPVALACGTIVGEYPTRIVRRV